MSERKRLVVLVSGNGSNLQAVLDACAAGRINGEVVAVIANRREAFGLERARRAGIEALYRPLAPWRGEEDGRARYEEALAREVAARRPDLVVLAGWMHVFGGEFLRACGAKVLNLHPALPGELPGKDAIARAWEQGQRGEREVTGVMVHEVVEEVDAGPVVMMVELPLQPGEALEALEARVHKLEHYVLVQAVALYCL